MALDDPTPLPVPAPRPVPETRVPRRRWRRVPIGPVHVAWGWTLTALTGFLSHLLAWPEWWRFLARLVG